MDCTGSASDQRRRREPSRTRPCLNQIAVHCFIRGRHQMPTKLTNEIITAAIEGFESQKIRIDQQISELKAMPSDGPAEPAATPEPTTRKRKRFSAAARKRMKEAQQRRWAKIRGEPERPAPVTRSEEQTSELQSG